MLKQEVDTTEPKVGFEIVNFDQEIEDEEEIVRLDPNHDQKLP